MSEKKISREIEKRGTRKAAIDKLRNDYAKRRKPKRRNERKQ